MSTAANTVDYFSTGYHAFVACDSRATLDCVVRDIRQATCPAPFEVVDARGISSAEQFLLRLGDAISTLHSRLDGSRPDLRKGLHGALCDLELRFRDASRQGFLVIHDIDDMIAAQRNIEIEAPFREVMQFYNDVAIMWTGSPDTIREIHQYERPFYLSHRIFWL